MWDTLNSGRVIPGFGHAVLRKTDPRYTCQVSTRACLHRLLTLPLKLCCRPAGASPARHACADADTAGREL